MELENNLSALSLMEIEENHHENPETENNIEPKNEELVRTKIGNKYRFVLLPIEDMLCYRKFCLKGLPSQIIFYITFCEIILIFSARNSWSSRE